MPALTERTQVGKREDLANIIAIVDAKECPVVSMIPKGSKPGNTLQEWQVDAFAAPDTGGVVDGQDVEAFENASENRAMLYGRIQRKWRKPMVSVMAESVSNVAGETQKSYEASVLKKTKELKRDIEATICSANESQEDNGVVPYKTRGLFKWITPTAQTDLPVPEAYRTPTASVNTEAVTAVDETDVQAVINSIWSKTGKSQTYSLICAQKLKSRFTQFSQWQPNVSNNTLVRQFNQEDTSTIYSSIDMFVGDFGALELIPSAFLNVDSAGAADDDCGLVLDFSLLELRYTQLPQHKELPNMGGGRRGLIDTIFALMVKNPLGLGAFLPT